MNDPRQQAILTFLASASPAVLGAGSADGAEIQPLPQGVWNFNYRVTVGGRAFVFKLYSTASGFKEGFITNSGETEYHILQRLDGQGIAPHPLHFGQAGAYPTLIYEYVPGDWFPYTDRATALLAGVYARLHSLPLQPGERYRQRDETPAGLLANIALNLARYTGRAEIPSGLRQRFASLAAAVRRYGEHLAAAPTPRAIVHTDPVASNIIAGDLLTAQEHVTLIDWQTPMIGDPAFDVWAFFSRAFSLWDAPAAPTPAQQALFHQTYQAQRPDPSLPERICQKAPFYLLQYALHCSGRYHDFLAGNLPAELTAGREANFEKYGAITPVILAECEESLVSAETHP